MFDRIWIDCLNGDKYKTGKLTPEGEPDPSVFSTESNREGIQVGTAITTLVRQPGNGVRSSSLLSRDFWGESKRAQLVSDAGRGEVPPYGPVALSKEIGFPFIHRRMGAAYLNWPLLHELFPQSFSGIKPARDELLVDIDLHALEERIGAYFNPAMTDQELTTRDPIAMRHTDRFDARAVRQHLLKRGILSQNFVRYCYRPFDLRWLYWEPETKLLDEKRADYFPHVVAGNRWLCAVQRPRRGFDPPLVASRHCSYHINELSTRLVPERTRVDVPEGQLALAGAGEWAPNVSKPLGQYLTAKASSPAAAFSHAIAVLHSAEYANENDGGLRQDWPRVPLPSSSELLTASARLGDIVAALLDPELLVDGVTSAPIRGVLRDLGTLSATDGSTLDPESGDLALTAGWGIRGKGGITMPSRGKVTERANGNLDIWLNDRAYWANVPRDVWEYTLGGYQVIKKWLSYREKALLGRDLAVDEARYVTEMVRRIAAILALGPKLNDNYAAVKADTYPWPKA